MEAQPLRIPVLSAERVQVGEIELSAGNVRLTFRPAGPVRGALLDLKEVRLIPVK